MRVTLAMNNLRNQDHRDAKSGGKLLARCGRSKANDFKDLLIGELVAFVCPAFLNAVVKVFLMGSKEQVRRVDALRVVSGRTVVEHFKAVWDCSICDQPRNPMSVSLQIVTSLSNFAVPLAIVGALPNPAPIRLLALFHLGPKAFKDRGRETLRDEEGERNVRVFGSFHNLLLDRALSCFRSVRAFCFLRSPTLTPMPVNSI